MMAFGTVAIMVVGALAVIPSVIETLKVACVVLVPSWTKIIFPCSRSASVKLEITVPGGLDMDSRWPFVGADILKVSPPALAFGSMACKSAGVGNTEPH